MSYTFHMTHTRLRNRGWAPNVAGLQTCCGKHCDQSFSLAALLPGELFSFTISFILFRPVNAASCYRRRRLFQAFCLIPIPCFPVFSYTATCTQVCFCHVWAGFTHTHAPCMFNSQPLFVSSVNKNAICQPHIAPVLNHRSHLAPRPFCTLWISKPPTSSERSAPSNPSQSACCERKQARFLFRHRRNALVSNLLLIPDHARDL